MQELPCYLLSGISSTYNLHKCILIEGDSANDIPTKIVIKGYTLSSSTFSFYIMGIYNPSTPNKYVSLSLKFHDNSNRLIN